MRSLIIAAQLAMQQITLLGIVITLIQHDSAETDDNFFSSSRRKQQKSLRAIEKDSANLCEKTAC
jgi:hypothetical protein